MNDKPVEFSEVYHFKVWSKEALDGFYKLVSSLQEDLNSQKNRLTKLYYDNELLNYLYVSSSLDGEVIFVVKKSAIDNVKYYMRRDFLKEFLDMVLPKVGHCTDWKNFNQLVRGGNVERALEWCKHLCYGMKFTRRKADLAAWVGTPLSPFIIEARKTLLLQMDKLFEDMTTTDSSLDVEYRNESEKLKTRFIQLRAKLQSDFMDKTRSLEEDYIALTGDSRPLSFYDGGHCHEG